MESDAARARFLKAISHDMRQPLQALMLYLSALDRRVPEGEARAILRRADQSAQALVSMFDNLTVLARIEAGKVEPALEKVSLQDLFDAAVDREPAAVADTTKLYVKSDAALLDQILRNLVSNAIKHGGGAARLSAAECDDKIEIAVSDEGAGIAAPDHARAFEQFERLDGASPDGLGLGLAIVRKLSDVLGHEVELSSARGQGATFIVRAPRG
jgi:signal transduction histidine kinase